MHFQGRNHEMGGRGGAPGPLRTREITSRDWSLMPRLFGPQGAYGGCWCMYWRLRPPTGRIVANGAVP
jgi:hypothetical protein